MTTSKKTKKGTNKVETKVNNVKIEESLVKVEKVETILPILKEEEKDLMLETYIDSLNVLNKLSYNEEGLNDPNVSKETKKGRKVSFEIPKEGTQSYNIYKYMEIHYKDKNFTIYKVCKTLNTPSNNTRRIFFKFFEEKRNEYLKSLETIKQTELDEIYEDR